MKRGLFVLLVLVLSCSIAIAKTIPKRGKLDKRIRNVNYSEQQVYQIDAQVGISTYLKFAEGEVFEKWYSGDAKAFKLSSHKNYVSFKPVVEKSNTNILVITNKRAYELNVHVGKYNGFYGVHFHYPEEKRRTREKEALLSLSKDQLDPEKQTNKNLKYVGTGSRYIRPTKAFDNGTHTYFYFPERTDMPSIFRVRRDNTELLVQPITIGNWRVVPRVQERWTLRLGDEVLCVRNLAYTTHAPENKTNTSSPLIQRIEKD